MQVPHRTDEGGIWFFQNDTTLLAALARFHDSLLHVLLLISFRGRKGRIRSLSLPNRAGRPVRASPAG